MGGENINARHYRGECYSNENIETVQTSPLSRLGKADGAPTEIVNGEVSAEEHVADDPERTPRKVDIHTREGADAGILDVENVVGSPDRERLAAKVEGQFRQAWDLLARYGVLTVPRTGGTNPTDKSSAPRTETQNT